ncbi:MAG: A/G-specific adenine glycosylase [Verrucomicrobia bacterium]|jgi:A/G-specific adenine glycosylase|nr:A/G-specific adenine glycosylase [Verrucomicrobiota bacterium]|tara:strand:+ start:24625 stop:25653 length:1029 start_codon:yes stop_codon:yes gene_type:complete
MSFLKPRFQKSALESTEDFRTALGNWFAVTGKDYPWRRTKEPYAILVSEMMLQQTRIATVLGRGFYARFLEKFPDVESLAKAGDEELLKAWEGLGYYRRARMLRDTAKVVIERHGGCFPDDEAMLMDLPGIGPYTCAALLAFAFGKSSSLVDGNVSRVLSRLMDDTEAIDSTPTIKRHREWAGTLCDPADPARHHHAMMELGQTICSNGVPDCVSCPVASFCKTSSPQDLPVKKPRAKTTETTEHAVWSKDKKGRVLLHHETGSRRTGLWKLPLRSAIQCAGLTKISETIYHITRYKVSLNVYLWDTDGLESGDEWITLERLDTLPMATPFRKVLDRLLADF